MKKSQNTIRTNTTAYKTLHFITGKIIPPVIAIAVFITFWQYLSGSELMPSFMMPSPAKVIKAFINDWPVLLEHAATTLREAFIGLGIGIVLSFIVSILMDACRPLYNALYPVIVVTQTIPSIAIAPLLTLKLLKSMGAGPVKRFIHIKLPYSLGYFFSGLKISVAYSIVGAVISEWLGGSSGLGVFMTRVRKSFAYDRMFSVIIFISGISLLLMLAVIIIKWLVMPWERRSKSVTGNK